MKKKTTKTKAKKQVMLTFFAQEDLYDRLAEVSKATDVSIGDIVKLLLYLELRR